MSHETFIGIVICFAVFAVSFVCGLLFERWSWIERAHSYDPVWSWNKLKIRLTPIEKKQSER